MSVKVGDKIKLNDNIETHFYFSQSNLIPGNVLEVEEVSDDGDPVVLTAYVTDGIYQTIPSDCYEVVSPKCDLIQLIKELSRFVPLEPTECCGNRCKEPHCVSCFGEFDAQYYVDVTLGALRERVAQAVKGL